MPRRASYREDKKQGELKFAPTTMATTMVKGAIGCQWKMIAWLSTADWQL